MNYLAKAAIFILLIVFSGSAVALPPPSAPSTSTGSFTITYGASANPDAILFVQERQGSGSWQNVTDPNNTGSIELARDSGTYEYRLYSVFVDFNGGEPIVEEAYSSAIQVVVIDFEVPPLDDIEDQLQYGYLVRAGDIDNDGLVDYFVQRTTGDLDNGVVAESLLRRQSNGEYTNFTPTPSQLSTAQSWPTADITITLGDFNFDEIVDVVVSNVPDGTIPQILISTGEYFGRNPISVLPLDDELQMFFADVSGWLGDKDYFADAVTPDSPGYNIRVDYLIETCYYGFGFPLCYTQNIKLLDFDISLDDLGLGDYLAKTSNTQQSVNGAVSSGGVSVEAVGAYISSNVHNMASAQLAEQNITTLHGNQQERTLALTKLAPSLPAVTDPQILRCVVFCGYGFSFGFDTVVSTYWVDTWTPITMPGEFDEDNFSADAFEASELLGGIFETGETGVSLGEWLQIQDIILRQQPAPQPAPIPENFPGPDVDPANDPDAEPKRRRFKFGFFGRWLIGLGAIEAAEKLNVRIRRNANIYHYTDAGGEAAIKATGVIIKPTQPIGGEVFFTNLVYPTDALAREKLALCGPVKTGLFVVPLITSGAGPLREVDPKLCDDGTHPQGGGQEQIALSPVNALPIRFIRILPDFEEDFIWQ